MTTGHDNETCSRILIDFAQRCGGSINATTAPPMFPNIYTRTFRCPHGIKYWIEPTNDQLIAWLTETSR